MNAVHAFALVGTTLIIVRGTLFGRLQHWYPPLFACSQCTGMWVGMAAGASVVPLGHGRILDAMIVGAATSFLSMMADAIFVKLLDEPDDPH